ncbi:hypothetical protein STEG23_023230, partial [Scotinomys teguina]
MPWNWCGLVNTVNDLTVHRATPEDLVRRHEIHKSKNRALAHWELQEKALKRKWKKQKPGTSSLEKRRLSIMKEILSDQYQMQDVLEKSDHLMAAAKGLFVDVPRKRTGFPNVTMAPDSSQSPIGVNQDPATQSALNESLIEPQGLNEVDNEEGNTVHSQSEDSGSELPLSSQSNRSTERFLHQLKEENSELINQLWTDIQQKLATQSQGTPPATPSPVPSAEEQKDALNGTDAVKRIQLQPEESAETADSSYVVGQMLNSRKQKQLLNQVKRKPDMRAPSKQKKNMLSSSTTSTDLPSGNNSSLDVLKHMIHEVEHEVEEYERSTGREVMGLQGGLGLTGFTLSLVSSLCRLVRYLKESEIQLRKEVETRQHLEQMLGDHRELIDALTAEILLLREENSTTQARLQQYMVTTDEQLISLTHTIKNCPVINNSRQEGQASERAPAGRRLVDNVEGPVVSSNVSVPLMFRGEEAVDFPQEELPVKLSQGPASTENSSLASDFPAHIFQPAVMLTPPRQKSNSEFSPLQDVLRRTVQTRPAPRIPPTVEVIEKGQNWEKRTLPVDPDIQNSSEENRLFTQRWRVSHMGEDLENKTQTPFVSLSQPPCNSLPTTQQSRNPAFSEEPPVLGDGQQLRTSEALVQRKDIMARIAELTLQNSAIKAHLGNITQSVGEQGDGLRELSKQGSASGFPANFPVFQSLVPSSMEERIAELNRQSMEARSKLLQLIEQQKLVGLNLSSPVSPVQSPLRAWAEEGKRTIEVSVPGVEALESSKCSTVSPVSGVSSRSTSQNEWRCCGNRSKRSPWASVTRHQLRWSTPLFDTLQRVRDWEVKALDSEDMKEPDDQDTDEGRSVSRSDGRKSSDRTDSRQAPEDTTDDLFTDGEESYFQDDLDLEDMEEDSVSSQDFFQSGQMSQELAAEVKEEPEETLKKKISKNFFYDYNELVSMPYVTPEADIPLDFLTLEHSFGYDCKKRANLQLLDNNTVLYIAGNQLVLLDLKTKEQIYLHSSSGQGIGAIGVHPDKTYFTVAEKGSFPNIIIYEYPSLKPYRILRDGTEKAYAYVDFNSYGDLLASVGSHPDYTITIWNWMEEQPTLRTKAFSQDVFKVTFNPEDDEQLTTSGSGHIKFWEMAFTFTGLKLQGSLGRFGKTSTSDIEGYTELPDGKVLSGSEWGNLLLWEGSLIKVELCRTGMKSCHQGPINQIMLDEGEVITAGSDGCVRIWDFETIDTADIIDDTGLLEIEPINELQVDKNVNLFSMIKMDEVGNNFWLAQDASGAIWKLDLSFSNITQDPECLFSFHSGAIEALAVSPLTYLMATTALDCFVRIYDFASKTPLVQMKFKQGGTSLTWVPRTVSYSGAQIVIGFEDGVVRILEIYDPKGIILFAGRKKGLDAEFHLKHVFKPHTAEVTALAYERDGEILATGSKDKTVFFFDVEKDYKPIGYFNTPGPVCQLIWSPVSHPESTLMTLCENGYILESPSPTINDVDDHDVVSYEIQDIHLRCFHFSSIKSKILRLMEIERREKVKELKEKEKEARRRKLAEEREAFGEEGFQEEEVDEEEEEEEEPLPEIFIPPTPSPILCGFYSEPGKFWVSL